MAPVDHIKTLKRLESELNQALLRAAEADVVVSVSAGIGPYAMGACNKTPRSWINVVRAT